MAPTTIDARSATASGTPPSSASSTARRLDRCGEGAWAAGTIPPRYTTRRRPARPAAATKRCGGRGLACREGVVAALHGVDEEVGDVDPVERLVEPFAGDGVAGDDGQVDADAGRVAREPPQLVAVLAQPGDEGGAGEAGHAGDEDAHPGRRYAMA